MADSPPLGQAPRIDAEELRKHCPTFEEYDVLCKEAVDAFDHCPFCRAADTIDALTASLARLEAENERYREAEAKRQRDVERISAQVLQEVRDELAEEDRLRQRVSSLTAELDRLRREKAEAQ